MRLTIFFLLITVGTSGCAALMTPPAAAPAPPTSATAGATTIVAVAPPSTPHPTLWQFLGSDQIHADMACKGQLMMTFLRRYFPALDGPPPPPPIDDPANLESPNPAVKAAAEVKAEEDAAPAKAQALEYLARIGCGCYPDVQDALLAGLDDCTEVVRFAAAQALYKAAGHPCTTCKSSSCCGPKVREKLMQIAYEQQSDGCYYEPSARVRRVARLALESCGGYCPMPAQYEAPEEEPIPTRPPPPPPVPGAEMAQRAGTASAELLAGNASPPAITRSSIMAASRLRPDPDARASETIMTAQAESEEPGRVVATIDGEPIHESEIDRAIARRMREFPQELSVAQQREVYLDELRWSIDLRLLLREANPDRRSSGVTGAQYSRSAAPAPRTLSTSDEAAARSWLKQASGRDITVTPERIMDRYRRNIAEYRMPAAVRWERVVVPFDPRSGRGDAERLIQTLRQRWLGGRPAALDAETLERVRVEIVEWSPLDSIQPASLQSELMNLAVGELSPVYEDGNGFQMVRVLQRRSETVRPLSEVSGAIEEELRKEARQAAEEQYLQTLRERASIWTIIPVAGIPSQPAPADATQAAAVETAPDEIKQSPVKPASAIGGRLSATAQGPAAGEKK